MVKDSQSQFLRPVAAGMLAWLVPGAGHVYLGLTARGVILCICIHAIFWAGIAFGGVFTVEPLGERWWFCAQICTGFSGGIAWFRQERERRRIVREIDPLRPPVPPPGIPGARRDHAAEWWEDYNHALAAKDLAPVYPAEIVARAYSGVAGMLNLMCIFDAFMLALMGRSGEPPAERDKPPGREESA